MTVQDVIDYVDSIEPNAYNNAQKARWVNECEGKVFTQLFLVQPYEFKSATQAVALPAPYDRMYPRYLQAMIHYANGEYDRYANSMAVFNEVWAEANRWFGGDYDVTDRLRNRRFEGTVTQELGDQVILEIPEGCAVAAGRILVSPAFQDAAASAVLWHNDPDNIVASADLNTGGATPLPMITGGKLGITLQDTDSQSTITLTGYLLIPDQEWAYDEKYARRRDARWRG